MLRFTGLVFILFFTCQTFAQGIEFFHGEWKEALALAAKEDKIVFVDAYAEWCGPCKRMAKNVFTLSDVGDFYNKNFINLKLDMEKADGRTFGAKYPVSAYPTLLFLDSEGNLLKKVTGGQQGPQLIALGETAIKSYDKSDKFAALYEEGKRDYELMVNYVRELNKVEKPSLKISNEYLKSNPDISPNQKALFLMEAVTEVDSRLFDQLLELKSKVIKQSSEAVFEEKVKACALFTVGKAVEYDFEDLLKEAVQKYKAAGVGDAGRFEQEANLEFHKLSGNFDEWKSISKKHLKKYGKKDISLYKTHQKTIQKDFSHNKEAINYSIDIHKDIIKKEESTENYMAYVQTLMQVKKNDDAIKMTKEAIKKSEAKDEDITQLERMLDYLNSI